MIAKDARCACGSVVTRSRRMEYDLHAAVLLGLESLIEVGAVGEIIAAVGDEESEGPGKALRAIAEAMGAEGFRIATRA